MLPPVNDVIERVVLIFSEEAFSVATITWHIVILQLFMNQLNGSACKNY